MGPVVATRPRSERTTSAGLVPLLSAPIPCPPGSVTPKPQPGNPKPRVFRIPELKWVGLGVVLGVGQGQLQAGGLLKDGQVAVRSPGLGILRGSTAEGTR